MASFSTKRAEDECVEEWQLTATPIQRIEGLYIHKQATLNSLVNILEQFFKCFA